MKILGIDPALASLGWGLIISDSAKIKYIDSDTIKTSPAEKIHKRLAKINNIIEQIIEQQQPDIVVMEESFINKNAVSSLKLGYVRGAIMSLVGRYNLPFYEYKPNAIKKAVVGVGHAEKEQVKHMINLVISGIPQLKSFDQYDALAVAYTGFVYAKAIKSNNG